MAIIGMGIDIVEIARLSGLVASYGDKFLNRIFTPEEIALCACASEPRSVARLAGRFAVKEAFYKALPASLQPLSSWKSVQTLTDGWGRPCLDVCDERLRSALFGGMRASSIHLSISHERAHCAAAVVIENC